MSSLAKTLTLLHDIIVTFKKMPDIIAISETKLNDNYVSKARFIRRISAVSNAIQTKDNEANHLIIYCLNCIRHGRNATYEPGLILAYRGTHF